MSDSERIDTRYRIEFIHGTFGDFYHQLSEYFSTYLYPRFEWKVINTYEKAVEQISKFDKYGRETDQPMLPALVLIPSGDFNIDENYGKMPWRFPNLSPGLLKRLMTPIYQDENVNITVGFSRFDGDVELIGLMASYYEYLDLKVYLNLMFGGFERYIFPFWLNSYIILPSDVVNFNYLNPYNGESYKIKILETINKLIKTTNRNELVYPFNVLPKFKLTSTSDTSVRLGGIDKLPDWRLSFTLHYEIEVPTFLVIDVDYLYKNFNLNIKYGSYYTVNKNPDQNNDIVLSDVIERDYEVDWGLSDETSSTMIWPSETELISKKDRTIKCRYYHIVSKIEADSTSNIEITLPEKINDKNLLLLYSKNGTLSYGDHYTISQDGLILTIIKRYVSLKENDILELYVYKYTYLSP